VLRTQILSEIIPCLELYVADVREYLVTIMEDKNRWWKIDRPVRDITIMDLDARPVFRRDRKTSLTKEFPSQLEQLQYTLSARLNTKRNENTLAPNYAHLQRPEPFTIHEMKLAAEVPCFCAKCRKAARAGQVERVIIAPLVPESVVEKSPF
jgi:hypothetical protein